MCTRRAVSSHFDTLGKIPISYTEASKLLYEKNETFHIEALYLRLNSFANNMWSMTSKASFAWKPRDSFSTGLKEANHSTVSFT